MSDRVRHRQHGEAECERYSEESNSHVGKCSCKHGAAAASENEPEGSDEFCGETFGQRHVRSHEDGPMWSIPKTEGDTEYMTGGVMRRLVLTSFVGMLIVPFMVLARAQAPSFASKALVDNDRVRIQRLTVPVGFTETMQVAPNDQIAIQVTPADLEVTINGQK